MFKREKYVDLLQAAQVPTQVPDHNMPLYVSVALTRGNMF